MFHNSLFPWWVSLIGYYSLILVPGTNIFIPTGFTYLVYLCNVFPPLFNSWLGHVQHPTNVLHVRLLWPRFVPFSLHYLDSVIGAQIEIGFFTILHWLYIVFYIYIGKNHDYFDSIEGVEARQVPAVRGSRFLHTFGTVDGGGELMRVALHQLEHVFAVRQQEDTVLPIVLTIFYLTTEEGASPASCSSVSSSGLAVYIGYPRLPKNLLNKKSFDFLWVEQSSESKRPPSGQVFPWEKTVEKTKATHQPKVVLECWKISAINLENGPTKKDCFARWSQQGYDSSLKLLHGLHVGSATNHHHLMIVRVHTDLMTLWN